MEKELNEEQTNSQSRSSLLARLSGSSSFAPNPSISRSDLNNILQGLKSEDEMVQLQTIMQLCDYLSIGTEDNMSNFSTDTFVPILVNLLQMEHNPEIMLLACRALTYLMEALPSSTSILVASQAIPILCARLLSIEYIDLAEQAIQCLEKISYEYSPAILSEGGMMACLSFLDFFPSGTQRTCVSTVANICKQVTPDKFHFVEEAIPILTNLIQYPDQKVVEKVAISFSRIAENVQKDEKKLLALTKNGLLNNLIHLLSNSTTALSTSLETLVLHLLVVITSGAPSVVKNLLENGIANIIQGILTGNSSSLSSSPGSTSTIVSTELYEILCLANEFLPPLSQEIDYFLTTSTLSNLSGKRISRLFLKKSSETNKPEESEEEEEEDENHESEKIKAQDQSKPPFQFDPREKILESSPQLTLDTGKILLPIFIQIFTSTANPNLRVKSLSYISKVIYYYSSELLKELLRDLTFSSFLANLLSSADVKVVAVSLKMCHILMEKLPSIFSHYFKKEGVVFEIEKLASEDSLDKSDSKIYGFIKESALQLKKSYFKAEEEGSESSEIFKKLKILLTKLKNNMKSSLPDEIDKNILTEISKVLKSEEELSTFEFIQSGITETFLDYLQLIVPEPKKSIENYSFDENMIIAERASLFCDIFYAPAAEKSSDKDISSLNVLVRKLNLSLNKVENFPVVLNESGGTTGLKLLTQPFKLKLEFASSKKNTNESSKEESNDGTVLIEPLATVQALRDFVKNRLASESLKENKENKQSSVNPSKEETTEEMDTSQENEEENSTDDLQNVKIVDASASYHDGTSSSVSSAEFKLFINNEEINFFSHSTIFQVLQNLNRKKNQTTVQFVDNSEAPSIHKLWETVHSVFIKFLPAIEDKFKENDSQAINLYDFPYIEFLKNSFKATADIFGPSFKILSLLRILWQFNTLWSTFRVNKELKISSNRLVLPPVEFLNSKLSSKLLRQLQDPLILCGGALPDWCNSLTSKCLFLFPFECRRLYFCCTSFGIARALQALQQNARGNTTLRSSQDSFRLGRIQRQKVRISRERILDSAMKVMELYAPSKAILEVEYFNEVGTGLGPTLEFYTLVSQELQKKELDLWRDEKPKNNEKFVYASGGLFPSPKQFTETSKSENILRYFKFIGSFIAKALLDSRLIDLPLSKALLKWMIGEKLCFEDLNLIDSDLASSLEKLSNLCKQKQKIEKSHNLKPLEKQKLISELRLGNCSIQDLELDFTVPGYLNWELKPGGSEIAVTIENLDEYINLLVQHHLETGIKYQLNALREGFDSVFPMDHLSVFNLSELESLLCGPDDSPWEIQTLIENTHCDHGFTHNSIVVQNFLQLLTEFNSEQKRKFLLFVTGSPRLPLGGFKSLEPKLTIVRKEHSKDDIPDNYLPSVNCCFYYLKLPEYSSKEVLKEKLFFAIENGQGHFSFN